MRVFNPLASSIVPPLCPPPLRSTRILSSGYGQRIREVECASFTPIVLSATEGFAHEASVFYKHLACLFKWGDEYSGRLFCSLCFSLLRSAIQCIRGAHSSIGVFSRTPPPMDLVRVESSLS